MDKAKLLGDRMPTESVAVDGGEVTVRALSRKAIHLLPTEGGDQFEVEAYMLHFGMADPALTIEEAREWIGVAGNGEIDRVSDAISRLSGIGRYSERDATKSAADESDSVA